MANVHALSRLVLDETLVCALYAYPVCVGIKPVDVVVGFLDKNKELTLAWDNERVFPMVGNSFVPAIPKGCEWIVAASFQMKYRRSICIFAKSLDLETLKEHVIPI